MTGDLLNAQEGGKAVLPGTPDGNGLPGPTITSTGIKMKIKLVNDGTTLPSYLVPKLKCGDGSGTPAELTPSTIVVTLSGENLQKLNNTNMTDSTQINKFKCEMISDFLTQGEKSAITIETYYLDTTSSPPTDNPKVNTIYFDDSLLSYYDSSTPQGIKKSQNPFLITATTDDKGSYTFTFDFDAIIGGIKNLESYKQIQNMFMFVNGIDSTKIPSTITQTALIKISEDAYLNLNFSSVPFATITQKPGPNLTITTTQPEIASVAACDLSPYFGSTDSCKKITDLLKPVLSLESPGYDFNCTTLHTTPPPINPAKQSPPPPTPTSTSTSTPGPVPGQASDATKAAKDAVNSSIGSVASILKDPNNQAGVASLPQSVKSVTDAIKIIHDNGLDPKVAHQVLQGIIKTNPNLQRDIDSELAKNSSGPMNTLLNEVKTIHSNIPAVMAAAMGPASAAVTPTTITKSLANAVTSGASATGETTNQVAAAARAGFSSLFIGDGPSGSACSTGDIAMECDGKNNVMKLLVPYKMIIDSCLEGKLKEALLSRDRTEIVSEKTGGSGSPLLNPVQQNPAGGSGSPLSNPAQPYSSSQDPAQQLNSALQTQPLQKSTGGNSNPPPPKITNISEIKAPAGAPGAPATPQTYDISGITDNDLFNQGNELLGALSSANTTLTSLESSVKDVKLPGDKIPSILKTAREKYTEADNLKNKIIKDATSMGTIAKAVTTGGMSLITLAPDAIEAYQKINEAVGLVNQAKPAVDAAIQAEKAEKEKAASVLNQKIGELQDNLKTNAQNVLEAANKEFQKITSPPSTLQGDLETAKQAIEKAEAAIKAISDAPEGTNKDPLIQTATDAVQAAVDAANKAKQAVAAAASKPPAPATGTDYVAYKAVYGEYDAAKVEFNMALHNAQALYRSGPRATADVIQAKKALQKAVEPIVPPVDITSIAQGVFDGLSEDAKKVEAIKELTDATAKYKKDIVEIDDYIVRYNSDVAKAKAAAAASGLGSGAATSAVLQQPWVESFDAASGRPYYTNTETKQSVWDHPFPAASSGPEPVAGAAAATSTRLPHPWVEQTDSTGRLFYVNEQTKHSQWDPPSGGSKPRSKSSSKSKSSSPKNKTKKNHSAPKSNKSKTPKIIMNE
jgi:hypothetical protein